MKRNRNLWRVHARLPKATEDYAATCVEEGMIAVGWDDVGSLNGFSNKEEIKIALSRSNDSPRIIGSAASCLWSFANDLDIGDIIVCPDSDHNLYYVGSVESQYYNLQDSPDECPFKNRREINWLRMFNKQEILNIFDNANFGSPKTVSQIHKGKDNLFNYLGLGQTKRGRRKEHGRPQRPDPEWGRLAELRALAWLRGQNYRPIDVAHLSRGWDIECNALKYEVKGRKTLGTRIIMTDNEFKKAKRYTNNYVLLIFTAKTSMELSQAVPDVFVDPSNSLSWGTQIIHILN